MPVSLLAFVCIGFVTAEKEYVKCEKFRVVKRKHSKFWGADSKRIKEGNCETETFRTM
jgi:hypothetical protein